MSVELVPSNALPSNESDISSKQKIFANRPTDMWIFVSIGETICSTRIKFRKKNIIKDDVIFLLGDWTKNLMCVCAEIHGNHIYRVTYSLRLACMRLRNFLGQTAVHFHSSIIFIFYNLSAAERPEYLKNKITNY